MTTGLCGAHPGPNMAPTGAGWGITGSSRLRLSMSMPTLSIESCWTAGICRHGQMAGLPYSLPLAADLRGVDSSGRNKEPAMSFQTVQTRQGNVPSVVTLQRCWHIYRCFPGQVSMTCNGPIHSGESSGQHCSQGSTAVVVVSRCLAGSQPTTTQVPLAVDDGACGTYSVSESARSSPRE
jgi:hypothetical protein